MTRARFGRTHPGLIAVTVYTVPGAVQSVHALADAANAAAGIHTIFGGAHITTAEAARAPSVAEYAASIERARGAPPPFPPIPPITGGRSE
jgi:hypothetical protein